MQRPQFDSFSNEKAASDLGNIVSVADSFLNNFGDQETLHHAWMPQAGPARQRHLIAKRAMDIGISLASITVLLPAFVLVAVLIRLDSKGPAIFTQTRWGRNGSKIQVYKFRSMYQDLGDRTGVAQTIQDDPRVTRIGRALRRSNIDELPQLFNVLKGDMSLVGPRCHAIGMLAAGQPYETLIPDYHRRHTMRPGMTGLAQMRGLRGPTHRPSKARARIACDFRYIDRFSIWLDCRIIVGTIYSEFRARRGF
jgi:polysaccharide biosynthesis protein PslA